MQQNSFSTQLTFFQKLRKFDYILLTCILLLGFISALSMYSTDGGEILFHSKSHISKFLIFFIMMIFLSFLNIKFWHYFAYLFYVIILIFLIWASMYGVKASGSQRWINLYFINLQPSELMKIAIIICLAKYYHRIQFNQVNNFQNIFGRLLAIYTQREEGLFEFYVRYLPDFELHPQPGYLKNEIDLKKKQI